MVRVLILCYHSVAPACHPDPLGIINRSLRVDTERFRCQMELLDRSFSIVPLESVIDAVGTGSPRRRLACVTLDDGYADNYEHAFPILRRLGIPATFFLPTESIEERQQFYSERLGWHLAQQIGRTLQLPAVLGGRTIPIESAADAGKAFDYLLGRMRTVRTNEREALLEAVGVMPSPYTRQLTWAEAAFMQAAGMRFGVHTHTHTSLPALTAEAIREEITASRDIIAKRLGAVPTVFAYPHGDFDERTERILAEEGFLVAVTIREGLCTAMSPCFQLPRMDPGNRNKSAFIRLIHAATGVSLDVGTRVKSCLKTVVPAPLLTTGKRIYRTWRTTH
jgi:peptidoglycan/xylan/chitin deacetylase (PgdA/CDA1 family)